MFGYNKRRNSDTQGGWTGAPRLEKQDILKKNCLAIFKIEPIDIPTARYCFIFSQYFKLKRDHQTLGFDVHHLINNVFNPQFDREMQKLGN